MWKLYDCFKNLQFQKKIVAAATICGNTVIVYIFTKSRVYTCRLIINGPEYIRGPLRLYFGELFLQID